jgi:hypothetical protein
MFLIRFIAFVAAPPHLWAVFFCGAKQLQDISYRAGGRFPKGFRADGHLFALARPFASERITGGFLDGRNAGPFFATFSSRIGA